MSLYNRLTETGPQNQQQKKTFFCASILDHLQKKMFKELKEKKIFDLARNYAFSYADNIDKMDVFPSDENLKNLEIFEEAIPDDSASAKSIISQLNKFGSPATTAQTGGRYFGFVNGGVLPISVATKWLADFWDQNGGMFLTSPINAKLEMICEQWLKELFNLPKETVAGFVSGTSTANFSGIVAARYRLLKNQGWDVNIKGLNGAPKIRIIAHQQAHSSITKALALAGFGKENVEWVESDDQGRMILDKLPKLDSTCLVFLQAGGLQGGGVNFDAKIRRNSTDMDDVFHAHIGGADTFARALLTADKILTSSSYNTLRDQRYSTFDSGKGKDFEAGKLDLNDLYKIAMENGELPLQSGKQELFENIINQYI